MRNKIGFVILHYLSYQETINAVASIHKYVGTKEYHIVVVDNDSPNGSGKQLSEIYENDGYVTVVLNKMNMGYAVGLNQGIAYLRSKFENDFIVLMNNDIYLIEDDFCGKVIREYETYQFGVMGPMILSGDGRCDTNPYHLEVMTKEYISTLKRRFEKKRLYAKMRILTAYDIYASVRKAIGNSGSKKVFMENHINAILHGSIWIVADKFFDYYDGLSEKSFMYGEEYFLHHQIMKADMSTLYSPNVKVFHEGSSSMKLAYGKRNRQRQMKKFDNAIQSLTNLLYEMENC